MRLLVMLTLVLCAVGCRKDVQFTRTRMTELPPETVRVAISGESAGGELEVGEAGAVVFFENTGEAEAGVIVRGFEDDDPTVAPASAGLVIDRDGGVVSNAAPIGPGGFVSLGLLEPGRYSYELYAGGERVAEGVLVVRGASS